MYLITAMSFIKAIYAFSFIWLWIFQMTLELAFFGQLNMLLPLTSALILINFGYYLCLHVLGKYAFLFVDRFLSWKSSCIETDISSLTLVSLFVKHRCAQQKINAPEIHIFTLKQRLQPQSDLLQSFPLIFFWKSPWYFWRYSSMSRPALFTKQYRKSK